VTGVSLRLAPDPRGRQALVLVTLAALVRLVFAALIPLLPDEAYYWTWSRHLAAGYFDHPPVLALLIRSGTVLLEPAGIGDSPLAVRIGAVAAGWIASVATIGIARRLAGDSAALRAAVIMSVLPLAAAGLILATPDAPVLAAFAAALYFVIAALQSPLNSDRSFRWWLAGGFALGVAFCSKYTSIFVPAGVLLAVLARADLRVRLREPGPYVACVVATIVFLPVLAWNAHHGWISFVFQVRHGLGAPKGSALLAAWHHEGDFFGGQAGLASPILFVMLAIATASALSRRARPERFVLAVVALLSFGFFVYSALRQRVEPNWPAPAYIPAIALLGAMAWGRAGTRWLYAGVALAAALSITIYAQGIAPVLPLAPSKDPVARAFGWDDLSAAADSTMTAIRSETHTATWLAGDRYQEASEMAFHLSSHPVTFATNLGGRANQYDLWPTFEERARQGDNLVLAVDETPGVHPAVQALAPHFSSVERGALVTLRRGAGVVGVRRLWVLRAYRGGWPR
jgi:4-amino-4-deoxy-L-arabinose transferase-like glycosyltransferase